jgi:hypothetical protein
MRRIRFSKAQRLQWARERLYEDCCREVVARHAQMIKEDRTVDEQGAYLVECWFTLMNLAAEARR